MKILYRRILISHIGPFLFGFFTVIFVFLMQFLTRSLDRFVGKGLETSVIAELIILQISWMVVLAAPLGVLSATLIAFGNMTSSLEITAIRAGGISVLKIMIPVLIAAAIMSFLVERFDNIVLPESNHRAKTLMMDISRKKPSFGLEENVFSNAIYGYSILARKTSDTTSDIGDVTIYDYHEPSKNTVITANRGKFVFSQDYRYLIMTLEEGEMHEVDRATREEYRKVIFKKHKVLLDATGFGFERSDESSVSRGDRELSADAMREIVDSLSSRMESSHQRLKNFSNDQMKLIFESIPESKNDSNEKIILGKADTQSKEIQTQSIAVFGELGYLERVAKEQRQKILDRAVNISRATSSQTATEVYSMSNDENLSSRYMVEVHKKYSIPFACFCFALVGVPLGVLAKRGGIGVGAGLSLLFFMIYWAFLISGEKLADRDIMPPWIAMWLGNIVISTIGLILLAIVSGVQIEWIKKSWRLIGNKIFDLIALIRFEKKKPVQV